MSEVVIELNLSRRSGVLAGAVAALRPLALEFRSQQLADQDGQPRLRLTTEGELNDVTELLDRFGRTRGIAEVADVRVDGQSVLHVPASSEPVEEDLPQEDSLTDSEAIDAGSETTLAEPTEPSIESVQDDEQVDGFNEFEFARHVLASQPESDDPQLTVNPSDREQGADDQAKASEQPKSLGKPTPAMLRRRRRRR